jgi:hypothetical protein
MVQFLRLKTIILLALTASGSLAQELDKIKGQKPLTIDGSIITNQVFNNQAGSSYDYSGYYAGNLTFNVYGVSIPFTFIYSNRKGNPSNPFNQFGLHPSYKWAKAHFGYASMSFSPYTLNGHLFLGSGVELSPPGIFRFSFMVGQLHKANNYDSTKLPSQMAYQRMGYGMKFGLVNEKDYVELILFKASDVTFSNNHFMDSLGMLPKENTVTSIRVGKTLFENLTFSAELAGSSLSSDKRALERPNKEVMGSANELFMQFRINTITRKAFKSNITYNFGRYGIGAGYERIDPGYMTLGSYFFASDLENITLNFNANIFDNKLSLSANSGLQRDNLDKNKMNTTERFVGSANASVAPNEKLNMNFSYSNFLSYTNARSTFDYINQTSPYENYDTLNYRQISQNFNVSGNYQLPDLKSTRHAISANVNYQISDDISGADSSEQSQFYNISTSYIFNLPSHNLSITTSINYNFNEFSAANTSAWGPGIGINKLFFNKKLRTFLSYSYNTSKTGNVNNGNITNYRIGGGYSFKKQHNFNISVLYQKRNMESLNVKSGNKEVYAITFGYAYNFSLLKTSASKKAKKETD